MAELGLRERLQPALLDRLVDEERLLTVFELTVELDELERLGLLRRDFADIVAAQGLSAVGEPEPVRYGPDLAPARPTSRLRLRFCAPAAG